MPSVAKKKKRRKSTESELRLQQLLVQNERPVVINERAFKTEKWGLHCKAKF